MTGGQDPRGCAGPGVSARPGSKLAQSPWAPNSPQQPSL